MLGKLQTWVKRSVSPESEVRYNNYGLMLEKIKSIPLSTVFVALGSIVTGLLIGFLISIPLDKLPYDWSWAVSFGVYVVAVALMLFLFLSQREVIADFFVRLWPVKNPSSKFSKPEEENDFSTGQEEICWEKAILLDTSAIIDGRIADIVGTGFIDGELVVPSFVLQELQRISDSSSLVKRGRGRRGLEILESLKKEEHVPFRVVVLEKGRQQDVDDALIGLASKKGARVITTDFNLNKVGKVRSVRILNINELANMVKTVLVPGEELAVDVIQEGKENGQGVAYLPDGTMIVVENGQDLIGQKVDIVVERFFQTDAGRMIFAKPV